MAGAIAGGGARVGRERAQAKGCESVIGRLIVGIGLARAGIQRPARRKGRRGRGVLVYR